MGKRIERVDNMLTFLRQKGSASLDELAVTFSVSKITVRRDLEYLARRKQVRMFRGGAAYAGTSSPWVQHESDYEIHRAVLIHQEEKQRIARYAAGLVNPGDVVFLDAGSTTRFLAQELTSLQNLTVIGYSDSVIQPMIKHSDHGLIMLGGTYYRNPDVFVSDEAQLILRRTRITKAFISARGIHPDLGAMCSNSFEVGIKKTAMQSSLASYLLADSSKFRMVHSEYFAEASQFHAIITNTGLPEETAEAFQERGITLWRV